MIAAMIAAAVAGALVMAAANPIWLGAFVTTAAALIPIPLRLRVTAISLSSLQIYGITIAWQRWIIVHIGVFAVDLWPLRICITDVRGCVNLPEGADRLKKLPTAPRFVKPLMPYLMSFTVKLLSLLQIEVTGVHLQTLPTVAVVATEQAQSLSIQRILLNRCKTAAFSSLHFQALNSTLDIRRIEAILEDPLSTERQLSLSIDDIRSHIVLRLGVRISAVEIKMSTESIEAVVHVATASAEHDSLCYIGQIQFAIALYELSQSLTIFGLRLHLDPIIHIVPYLQPLLNLFPNATPPQNELNLLVYGADFQVTALKQTVILANLEEIEVQAQADIAVSCRKLCSRLNSHDTVRISSLSLCPTQSQLLIEAGIVNLWPQFEFAPLLLPMTQLMVDLYALIPRNAPSSEIDVQVKINSLQASLPRMFDVTVVSAKIDVNPLEFVLRMLEPACFYESSQFLSLRCVEVSGSKATSKFPHPTIAVTGDAVRGHWSPSMQFDLLYLIKQIVATVIRCKHDLFPLLFPPSDQRPPPLPTQVACGLPHGENSFYDWAFHDRAPYLLEKLQIVSLSITDLLLTASLESSLTLTIYAERFLSEFLPWHWHLSRFAICLESFPLLHVLSMEISRDLASPDVSLADVKCDPLLSEPTVKLLMYAPIRISTSSISMRIPNSDSHLYDSVLPLSILYHARGLVEAMNSIPSLNELARQHNGPGYNYPPDFGIKPVVRFRCLHFTFCLIDTIWDSWIHQVRPVGLDERMGSDARRELLRLKIRDHQRRTGQFLSDAKISLMSSRLAESNFELYRNRIVRLKAMHSEKWSFPQLDCVSKDLQPGNLHLGSLLSVTITDLGCKLQLLDGSNDVLLSTSCSLQTESFEVSLRQFCPSVVDISKLQLNIRVSILQDNFVPTRSCNMDLSPRYQIQFLLPVRPPFFSISIDTLHVEHPCVTLSPTLLSTLKDVSFLCTKLRPSFVDEAVRSLSILDLIRFLFDVQKMENVLVANFSVRIVQQMAFCTSTEPLSSPSVAIKGSHFKASFNMQSNLLDFSLDELTISLSDEQCDSNTMVHMSHESVHKPVVPGADLVHELFETRVLLHCFKIDASVKSSFMAAAGVPSATRLALDPAHSGQDPFASFRTHRVAATLKLCVGSQQHQTKITINTHNLPLLLRLYHLMPSLRVPDLSMLQLRCSHLSVSNCSFSVLDVASDKDPGQGLRFRLREIQSKFDINACAIHNLSISVLSLNASLVANDAFWRKCETGHELAHDIRNGTVVVVHTYENQRFILGQGWLDRLLPTDRPNWSDVDGTQELRRDSPLFDLPSEHWHWKSDWVIDRGQLCGKGKVDSDGWEYAHDFPRAYTAKRHWTDNVRRRRWFRVRRLVDSIDENIRMNIQEKRNRRQNGLLFIMDAFQLVQKPCSTLIFRVGSPLHSPSPNTFSVESPKSPSHPSQVKRVTSLLTFFSIGTQPSPMAAFQGNMEALDCSASDKLEKNDDEVPFSSPYLFAVKITSPKARMTLESRNALVQLFRAYFSHFEYYYRLRSAPIGEQTTSLDEKENADELVFSAAENSDDDETDLNDSALSDSNQPEDDAVETISQGPTMMLGHGSDPNSINPVDLLDILSIEITNGQVALESPVESACGIVLACMQSCLVTARSFDGDGSKQASERIDVRLLIDNLTIRLAPTDIDVDAKPMWFDFEESGSQSVMKAIFNPFPVQATAMFFPFSSSPHNVFLLLPTITATLDHLQCALLESIMTRVLLAELPLPPIQSATEFVRFSFAGMSAFDSRITNHQRLLWQIRHLEWLMGVYSASEPTDEADGKSDSGELALLAAHLCSLRQQFVDSIMSVAVDFHTRLSALFTSNPVDIHFRLEALVLSLVSVNRIEFLRTTVTTCSGLLQVEFKGEGSLQACFDIRDVRVVDARTDMEDWKNVVIPAYLCGSNGLANSDQNAENRAVMTLQCVAKRVGGIIVICSCVLNVAHLVIRITQSLIDDLSEFATASSATKAERKIMQSGASIVPKASGILAQVNRPEPISTMSNPAGDLQDSNVEESTPAHLRDLRLYCERSQNSIIITFLRIGAVRATISFKGYGSGSIADFQGVSVRMPSMTYQKKTWTMQQFARRLRRDLIKAALRQAGPGLASFLRYKFGGASTDMSSFSYGTHDDLSALDIDVPVGSIPIQPSPHPIAKAKTAVGDIINKFKSGASDRDRNGGSSSPDKAEEEKDPDRRHLLFGKQNNA